MITIILHHAALELANDKICNMVHKAIINDARARRKKPTELLLDIAVHQSAIYPEKLQFSGRPDLVHFFLLQYHHMIKIIPEKYSSEINLYVHTKNNQIFFVPQSWRVPVHFIRFRGLMEKFLIEKTINFTNTDKIELQETTLKELIESLDPTQIFNLTELGEENEN